MFKQFLSILTIGFLLSSVALAGGVPLGEGGSSGNAPDINVGKPGVKINSVPQSIFDMNSKLTPGIILEGALNKFAPANDDDQTDIDDVEDQDDQDLSDDDTVNDVDDADDQDLDIDDSADDDDSADADESDDTSIDGDLDGDGVTGEDDCNDGDASVYTGATEDCEDLIDNDCDGDVDSADVDCIVADLVPEGTTDGSASGADPSGGCSLSSANNPNQMASLLVLVMTALLGVRLTKKIAK